MRASISGPRCDALPTAPEIFGEPIRDFEPERDRFRVDAVRAADLRRVAEFMGAKVKDFREDDEIAFDDLRGVAYL